MALLKKSTAANILFYLVDATDNVSPITGVSPTVTLSKDAGAFGAAGGSVSEVGNGWYALAANTTDTSTNGELILHATATGAIPADDRHQVISIDLTDSVRLGLTALPNAAAEAAGGLYTRGSGAGQITQSNNGRIDSDVISIANGVIAAATFAANALDAVWSTATRLLTAGTNIVLAKGTGVTGLNDLDASGVRTAVGLATANLDTQLAAIKTDVDAIPTVTALTASGVRAAVGLATANLDTQLAAIKTDVDAIPTVTALTAAGVRTAVGLATANLDTQLAALDADILTRLPTSSYVAPDNSDISAIKAKTDNLPASPASTGDVTTAEAAVIAAIPFGYKKNTAVGGFQFRMFDSSGAPATGLTVTVKVSKDGGALTTSSNSASELSLGWYKIDLTSGEMNAKSVALNFQASGATSYGIVLTTEI